MPTSLFIERHDSGLAFYINGDLQFDTADEALYHEYLAVPAIALAVGRFPQGGLRVLICGGGDGLAARDVLRFPQVSHIDLVDCNPEVLELANTVFKPHNAGSLASARVRAHVREAFEFVSAIPDCSYHAVICDFTYPTRPEETGIYSREWFQQVSRVLVAGGIVSTNGVSPENRTTGFWCLYQTLLSAGVVAKPLQLSIPSFQRHGYGKWGFFLGSPVPVERGEIEGLAFPDAFPENLRALTGENLLRAFVFDAKIASGRHEVPAHTLACPQLFYYLLNPAAEVPETAEAGETVDFLDIQEAGTGLFGSGDLLELESVARAWLETMAQSPDLASPAEMAKLLPVQHRYQSPKMAGEWLAHVRHLLGEIDISRLLSSLLERAQELPPKIAGDLRELADKIRTGDPLSKLPPSTAQVVMILSVTLLMANLQTPDAVFAKGFSSGGSRSFSGGTRSYSSSGGSGGGTYDDSINWMNKMLGFILTAGGCIILAGVLGEYLGALRDRNDE